MTLAPFIDSPENIFFEAYSFSSLGLVFPRAELVPN